LVDILVAQLRSRGHRVAVLAVDPSSPFSGGAILGDRIRMMGTGTTWTITELGRNTPQPEKVKRIGTSEVGWLVAAIKTLEDVRVGDTITMAPSHPDEVSDTSTLLQDPSLETSLEDALGFLDEEVIDSDDACGLLGDPLPHATEEPENSVTPEGHAAPLEPATLMLWSGLFALPSLAALLVSRLPLGSEVTQTLSRVGSTVQARCGDFLDQFVPWIGSF
jgi:hypothetical protein